MKLRKLRSIHYRAMLPQSKLFPLEKVKARHSPKTPARVTIYDTKYPGLLTGSPSPNAL
jgi:hypothetical protein